MVYIGVQYIEFQRLIAGLRIYALGKYPISCIFHLRIVNSWQVISTCPLQVEKIKSTCVWLLLSDFPITGSTNGIPHCPQIIQRTGYSARRSIAEFALGFPLLLGKKTILFNSGRLIFCSLLLLKIPRRISWGFVFHWKRSRRAANRLKIGASRLTLVVGKGDFTFQQSHFSVVDCQIYKKYENFVTK